MPIPPTFVTPVEFPFMMGALGGPVTAVATWLVYFVSIGIYHLVADPGSSDWWFMTVRFMYGVGAAFCGGFINWYVCKYWAGRYMFSLRWKKGHNKFSTVLTGIAFLLITGRYLVYELVQLTIFDGTFPDGRTAIRSSYEFGWEGGLKAYDTIILTIIGLFIGFAREERIAYDMRGAFTWLYIAAIGPIWPTYGLSFMRFINWIPVTGEDWIVQGINLGFIGVWTLLYLVVAIPWRQAKLVKACENEEPTRVRTRGRLDVLE